MDQYRRLEVREKARKFLFFVMSLNLSDHKVLDNIASSSSFFRFRSDFLAFLARISYSKFLESKEFNKIIIPFALVGYETGYSQLGATRWLFTISYPTRTHGIIIVNYCDWGVNCVVQCSAEISIQGVFTTHTS